jgi:hypothetical protein
MSATRCEDSASSSSLPAKKLSDRVYLLGYAEDGRFLIYDNARRMILNLKSSGMVMVATHAELGLVDREHERLGQIKFGQWLMAESIEVGRTRLSDWTETRYRDVAKAIYIKVNEAEAALIVGSAA